MEDRTSSTWVKRSSIQLILITVALLLVTATAGAQDPDKTRPDNGQSAVDARESELPGIAANYGLSTAELETLLLQDPTLHIDNSGQLLYVDVPFLGDQAATQADLERAEAAPFPTEDTFKLHSLPSATHKIYLDFTGHTTEGTTWNSGYNVTTIVSPPYDIDGNPSSFSATEIENIQKTWQIVAEDYAPFDIDVTTEDPGALALSDQGGGDVNYGTRVVITDDTFANCGCGGHAYIGSFDDPLDEPVFVYNSSLVGVSEASSHEVGHAVNLSHDGTSTDAYYTGHGSGATSWAPIMGAGYYVNVSHWSKGEYYDANNAGSSANYGNGPDDLAVIASLSNGNGFGYRSDDHGDTSGTATSMATNGNALSGAGIVEGTGDVDVFVFNSEAGQVELTVQPGPERPNLDVIVELRDDGWDLIATADSASILSASLSATVPTGTYYLTVDGTGVGDPFSSTPTGYTQYGSIGQYTISGTAVNPDQVNFPPSFNSDPIVKADATTDEAYSATLSGDASDPNGDPLTYSKVSGPAWLTVASNGSLAGTPAASDAGLNSFTVKVDDGNGGSDQATLQISVIEPVLFVDFTATGEIPVSGTVSGSYVATQADGGAVQTISERESGGKPAKRYSYLDHKWTFSVQPGTAMILYANAWAPSSSDGDTFKLSYSTNDSSYIDLDTLDATSDDGTYQTFTLPEDLNGTVYIHLEDTDRSTGHRALDTVTIDHLFIRSDTQMPDPPAAPSGLNASAAGASQIDLSWQDNAGNEQEFRIERSPGSANSWTQIATVNANVTTYSDLGLTAETTYDYRVNAHNAGGTSAYSNTASDTTGSAGSMHVAGMAGSSAPVRNRWNATVTITIVDQDDAPVSDATVSGSWSAGATGGATCTTAANGQCSVTKTNLKSNVSSVTFSITGVQHATTLYDEGSNVISSIEVFQP